jgi:anti-sigma-K factor RskA
MNSTNHIDQNELALFAMQLLSQDEAAPVKLHLEHCSDCRRELAEIQGDLATYAMTAEMHSPPAQARDRLLKQVGHERRETKVRSIERGPEITGADAGRAESATSAPETNTEIISTFASGRRLTEDDLPTQTIGRKILPWLGWAMAAGLAVTAGDLYHERSVLQSTVATEHADLARLNADAEAAHRLMDTMTDPTAMRVTLTRSKQAPVPQGKATYVPDKGSLVFIASNMEPLNPYKVYELWIIPADGRNPIPAGTFHPDERGNASVIMPELPKGVPAKAFGITIEDQGGSRTPTMPIIMAGT